MFKKILSSIGIGAAKVDLILDRNSAVMGESIQGKVVVTAGQVEQQIGKIDVQLRIHSSYTYDDQQRKVDQLIREVKITDGFTLKPGETKEYPVSFVIPEFIPVSSINSRYYFLTNLDIQAALDHKDRDFVHIYPSGLLKNFMQAFQNLGFEPKGEGYTGDYQIIDFRPTRWLAGKLDELVFQYQPAYTQNAVSGYFEIDKKNHGLGGWLADEMDLDEKKGRFQFSREDLATVDKAEQTIRTFIERYYNQLI